MSNTRILPLAAMLAFSRNKGGMSVEAVSDESPNPLPVDPEPMPGAELGVSVVVGSAGVIHDSEPICLYVSRSVSLTILLHWIWFSFARPETLQNTVKGPSPLKASKLAGTGVGKTVEDET